MDLMSPGLRKFAIAYFRLQGMATVVWWAVLLASPAAHKPFLGPGQPDNALMSFLVADLVLFAGGSFATAVGLTKETKWAQAAMWATTGAGCYAALSGISMAVLSNGGWGAFLMLPALVFPPYIAWQASK